MRICFPFDFSFSFIFFHFLSFSFIFFHLTLLLLPRRSCRVHKTLVDHLRTTTLAVDAKLVSVAMPLVPLVEALATTLSAFADINRRIHTPTYNRLIAAAVDECGRVQTD